MTAPGQDVVAVAVAAAATLLVQRARLRTRQGEVDPRVTSEEPWQRLRRTGRAVRGGPTTTRRR